MWKKISSFGMQEEDINRFLTILLKKPPSMRKKPKNPSYFYRHGSAHLGQLSFIFIFFQPILELPSWWALPGKTPLPRLCVPFLLPKFPMSDVKHTSIEPAFGTARYHHKKKLKMHSCGNNPDLILIRLISSEKSAEPFWVFLTWGERECNWASHAFTSPSFFFLCLCLGMAWSRN